MRLAPLALLAVLPACSPARTPTASTTTTTPARCPLVPLRLLLTTPTQPPIPVASLAADGAVTLGALSDNQPVARLDTRGCLVGHGGTWVEVTARGDIWSAHETLRLLPNGALELGAGRSIRVEPDGAVRTFDAAGQPEPDAAGRMSIEGFTEPARCAAHALLATFLGAMPSMAASDGHPREAPIPAGSACPHAPLPHSPAPDARR